MRDLYAVVLSRQRGPFLRKHETNRLILHNGCICSVAVYRLGAIVSAPLRLFFFLTLFFSLPPAIMPPLLFFGLLFYLFFPLFVESVARTLPLLPLCTKHRPFFASPLPRLRSELFPPPFFFRARYSPSCLFPFFMTLLPFFPPALT